MRSPVSCQRRHAGRLIALNVEVHGHGRQGNVLAAMAALRSADDIRDVNTRYHDVAAASYDSKWGIDFGDIGQGQVLGKLRKLLGRSSTAASAGRSRSAPARATSA